MVQKDFHQFHERRTLGQKAADKLTSFAGSWGFLVWLTIFVIIWMAINVYFFVESPWDPYPFILLNLVLACLAVFQAPIILMSQNRQEQKDRIKADYDYKVNIKAEREVEEMQKQLKRIEAKLDRK
ncbi:DUF1003 domain-containing protein [Candidatus Pacearchaeota archaeon]|nr:DUF1003 domain-containing protein [Candidatus Pacearchaeota archaeon]